MRKPFSFKNELDHLFNSFSQSFKDSNYHSSNHLLDDTLIIPTGFTIPRIVVVVIDKSITALAAPNTPAASSIYHLSYLKSIKLDQSSSVFIGKYTNTSQQAILVQQFSKKSTKSSSKDFPQEFSSDSPIYHWQDLSTSNSIGSKDVSSKSLKELEEVEEITSRSKNSRERVCTFLTFSKVDSHV